LKPFPISRPNRLIRSRRIHRCKSRALFIGLFSVAEIDVVTDNIEGRMAEGDVTSFVNFIGDRSYISYISATRFSISFETKVTISRGKARVRIDRNLRLLRAVDRHGVLSCSEAYK